MNEMLHYARIGTISAEIRASSVSPVDLVDLCLSRIDALNPRLNAFITVLHDRARAAARRADDEIRSGGWRGALHGVPVAVKDFYDTAGVRTTAGSARFTDRIPRRDADVVAALDRAGAILVGKTNMHQLGMGTTGLESGFGAVRNPWNEAFIPGGSSSGSAAAVAAGLCYATIDTDAIGSCRLPAACCGVVGFKASYGAISVRGILDGEPVDEAIRWLAHPGITTRGVADAAIVFAAVANENITHKAATDDPSSAPRLRIGTAEPPTASADLNAAFCAAVETIRGLGHEVTPAAAPFDVPRFGDLRTIAADRQTVAEHRFKEVDVVVLPTLTTPVPRVEASANPQSLSPANTLFANYFGLPAISVPCGFDGDGLPLGIQVVGKPMDEATLLRVAREYEAAATWSGRHPLP